MVGALVWAVIMVGLGILFVAYVKIAVRVLQAVILGGMALWILYLWTYKKEVLKTYWADKMEEMEEKTKK